MISWNPLTSTPEVNDIIRTSDTQPAIIFKHSTRCGISAMVKNQLEIAWADEEGKVKPYYLDLIRYRDVSNQLADIFGVMHQSPQVLVIVDGKCVYHASHHAINFGQIMTAVRNGTAPAA